MHVCCLPTGSSSDQPDENHVDKPAVAAAPAAAHDGGGGKEDSDVDDGKGHLMYRIGMVMKDRCKWVFTILMPQMINQSINIYL